MSVISLLIIDPSLLPTIETMRAEVEAAKEELDLYDPVDLRTHKGFLPVRVSGRDTGFEYYFDPVSRDALPPEATRHGSHHIVTRTFSDFEEARAALLFLKIAARLTGGAYVYPDDGLIVAPQDTESYLAGEIEELGRHIGSQARSP